MWTPTLITIRNYTIPQKSRSGRDLESTLKVSGALRTPLGTCYIRLASTMIYLISISGQVIAGASNVEDLEKVVADAPMLQQKMKPRHLQMIAVGAVDLPSDFRVLIPLTSGGSIGTGLFVGSGSALHHGGPAGVLIAWILIGVMLINVTQVGILFSEHSSTRI